ncbi:MAG: ATP synthase F0 subunit B [Candidatus Pacebacteria bacterium]|jgi:F-type H+-transporting ATPase subunit b|nr:ATP synthase F0 subunit B [Candidatus Paceibacterota bacterium]
MHEIISTFGVDARLIVIQIINFFILMVGLWYFLYTPVLKILSERQAKIEEGVRDADAAKQARAAADAERASIVAAANEEAATTAQNARAHAEAQGADIVKNAESRAENIVADAVKKGEELAAKAQKESEAEVAKIAVLAAERILIEKQ